MDPINESNEIIPSDPIKRVLRSAHACYSLSAFAMLLIDTAEAIDKAVADQDSQGAGQIVHNLIVIAQLIHKVGPIGIYHGMERGLTDQDFDSITAHAAQTVVEVTDQGMFHFPS